MRMIRSYGELRAVEKEGDRDAVVETTVGFMLALRANADTRDHIAQAALTGLLMDGGYPPDVAAIRAYDFADAMCAERDKSRA